MLKDVIKGRRLEIGLSVNALARVIGVSSSRVWQIEEGTTKDPQFSTVCKLADALGITLEEIRTRSNEDPPQEEQNQLRAKHEAILDSVNEQKKI